jgi:hypothetical protein
VPGYSAFPCSNQRLLRLLDAAAFGVGAVDVLVGGDRQAMHQAFTASGWLVGD